MQRIACVTSVLLLLSVTGCQTGRNQSGVSSAPPPALLKTTRVTKRPTASYRSLPLPPPPAPIPPEPAHWSAAPTPAPKAAAPVPRSTPLNISWRPNSRLNKGKWKVIVVHHSATENDTVETMHKFHRDNNGWRNGLGYHFVIGNGVKTRDGRVYKGPRWDRQQTGAHCKSYAGRFFGTYRSNNFFNEHGIGICLIGNFENGRPTRRQMAALKELTAQLCSELNISAKLVYGHGQITGKTACPGNRLKREMAAVRRAASRGYAMGTAESWDQHVRPQVQQLAGRAQLPLQAMLAVRETAAELVPTWAPLFQSGDSVATCCEVESGGVVAGALDTGLAP